MPTFAPFLLEGKCVDVSYEGKGVFKSKKKTVFVDGLLPGEEAVIEVSYSRNGTLFGEVRKILVPSPFREKPHCPHFLKCGGCAFQNVSYEAELEIKRKIVEDQLKKLSGIEFKVAPTIGMEDPTNYRNKIQMPVGRDRHGHVAAGFYAPYSHRLIPVEACINEDPLASKIIKDLVLLFDRFDVLPYDEDRGRGDIRHIVIRTSKKKREALLGIVCRNEDFPRRKKVIELLLRKHPEVTSVVLNVNPRKTNVILGEKNKVVFGKGYLEDSLLGVSFKISLSSFFQTNVVMAEKLFQHLINHAEIRSTDVVLDAYSGIGTIGLLASQKAKQVIAVESVPSAVKDARETAIRNEIPNFTIELGDATEYIGELAKAGEKIDVVIMDPPRKGSTPEFLHSVLKLAPRTLVYVSCNPGTLSRDLVELKDRYQIAEVQPFDMFPRTHHVETLVVLNRNDA